jgi:DeoR/GlpR family transcriptional regulator of sugar metabolism
MTQRSHRYKTSERRARVLELLETRDFVSVQELSDEFSLTEMSVRRDLMTMATSGLITRVRGGASRAQSGSISKLFAEASQKNVGEKIRIARKAAELLEPSSVAFFYSGTTVARVAMNLSEEVKSSLTVVTNSLPIIDEVSNWDDPHLVAVGGLYLPSFMAFVGPQALHALEELSADTAVIGCDGLSADGGLTTPHQLVAQVGAALIDRSSRTIVVADSSKVGKRGFTPIAPITSIDVLVTDAGADPHEIEKLRAKGIEVIIVG